MRILFVADGRSPITKNWIKFFIKANLDVHLVSTHPCDLPFELASFKIVPIAFSSLEKESITSGDKVTQGSSRLNLQGFLRSVIPLNARTRIRQLLGPYTLPRSANKLRYIIQKVEPDLIHAMRIPFEAMLTAIALRGSPQIPLVVSVWGNDFTLHASSSRIMSEYTHEVMARADALHTDTNRDKLVAREWGFNAHNPVIMQPCAGGVDMGVFFPRPLENDPDVFTIINPRGYRAYVRNDTFFRSIPLIIKERTDVRFICPSMEGEIQAMQWISSLDISRYVRLLPPQLPGQMADLFRESQITASITTHDGTPNSLLEAMACGCFPVVGDIDSLREWITQDVNGILIDPGNPEQLAEAILKAIDDIKMRESARKINTRLVEERAEYQTMMAETARFYKSILSRSKAVPGL